MLKILRFAAACVVASVMLVGCVSLPPQQAFNKAAHADIKTIYVLPARPVDFRVFMMNNPAASFGLIGALIASGQESDMEKTMTEIQDKTGFQPLPYFKGQLTADMEQRGYHLIWPDSLIASSKFANDAYGLRKNYLPVNNADATLDFAIDFYGYAAGGPGHGSPYRPTVTMGARLVSRDGKENLFTDYFAYNNVFNRQQAVTLDADEHYAYPMFSDLKASGDQSVAGLKKALDSVAAALAEQF